MVMSIGFKNAPTIFSRIVVSTFKDFIHKFIEVYFYDLMVYGIVKDHSESLNDVRMVYIVSYLFRDEKCVLCAPFRVFLGHFIY